MFNRMKTVVTFAAGAVAGLMLAACLTVQGSRPGAFGGEALILPLMAPAAICGLRGRAAGHTGAGGAAAAQTPGRAAVPGRAWRRIRDAGW